MMLALASLALPAQSVKLYQTQIDSDHPAHVYQTFWSRRPEPNRYSIWDVLTMKELNAYSLPDYRTIVEDATVVPVPPENEEKTEDERIRVFQENADIPIR